MSGDEDMSPDASPGSVRRKSGVRRVNNLPVYLVGGAMGIFLLVMALAAWDRSAQQNRPADQLEAKAGSTSMFASEIAGSEKDGFVAPAKSTAPPMPEIPPPGAIIVARPDDLEAPPRPPGGALPLEEQRGMEERERSRMDKLRQLDEAVRSRTTVQAAAPRSAGSAPGGVPLSREEALTQMAALQQQADAQGRDNPAAAYLARLQQLQAASLGDTATRPVPPAEPAAGGKDYHQFDVQGQGDRWRLDSRAEAPRSPYELRAGFIVPAVLISGVNSDLPGQIVAQVSQDVFDTATGKWRLIPQGSRLVGQYSSDIAYGQSRVLVAWQRIVFPDGKAMDIGSMPGADSAGYAGFRDQVNNHYFRLFSSAFLMSGITAGIAMSQPQTLSLGTRQSASSAMSEALGQQLGQVTAQLIARNMNIAPTLEIRPGYRFNVIVTKDLTFSRPYKAFDY
ncbi:MULTISPECIES: TrbI/VirB10 family protein [unclassified Janthinobacterium]|uniref:TrbI/VirB10 family protein n=1 Tax=unclassified Janthinobacterium TaxID=2610881 RepID=UPI00088CB4E6|nr:MULTISPECIES: TrbI/VirB10 family protein [unclassified Janthinobacterium]SDA75423.1 type IV secretion system protein VirB10 [Janthinobacterium sp. 551a]SFB57481.1 type IV secretion system protein VirB10 [Janthinobacterium sp. 344]